MKRYISLPRDELPHENQAIEWWYFNGFLKGKHEYAFMTSFFKADKDRSNLKFLSVPIKTVYFSNSFIFDLVSRKMRKEILPIVIVSSDSFSRKDLLINYFYPIRKSFINYEISRNKDELRLKNSYLDILLKEKKNPIFEGGRGFINLGEKATFYYSYPNLEAEGWVGDDKVKGKVWHDKQWSDKGFMNDHWIWFSFQLENNTEIVCFDYKGKKIACVSHPDNKQEDLSEISFKPLGNRWKSPASGLSYTLNWEIKMKNIRIITSPILKNCEMNFGNLHYWEGPIIAEINGKKARGFMEFLSEARPNKTLLTSLIDKEEKLITDLIRRYL